MRCNTTQGLRKGDLGEALEEILWNIKNTFSIEKMCRRFRGMCVTKLTHLCDVMRVTRLRGCGKEIWARPWRRFHGKSKTCKYPTGNFFSKSHLYTHFQ